MNRICRPIVAFSPVARRLSFRLAFLPFIDFFVFLLYFSFFLRDWNMNADAASLRNFAIS